jgi:hypothetical protein
MARLRPRDYYVPVPIAPSDIAPTNKPGFLIREPLPNSLRALYTIMQRALRHMKRCEGECQSARSDASLLYREAKFLLAVNRYSALQSSFEASVIEYYLRIGCLDPSLDFRTATSYTNVLRDWSVYMMMGPRSSARQ